MLSKAFKSICLIGITGHGKSSTANSIANDDTFKVSADAASETNKV
jgi:predicted GTPase